MTSFLSHGILNLHSLWNLTNAINQLSFNVAGTLGHVLQMDLKKHNDNAIMTSFDVFGITNVYLL